MSGTLLSASFVTASQDLVVATDSALFDGNFFPTVIAGVILALAFQFILTALSVAMGLSSVGNLKEKYAESTQNLSKSGEDNYKEQHLNDVESPITVKVTTGFGIWSVVTTCIALFLATMIALNLNGVITRDAVIANSLVIWALFFIILFYFEAKVAGTIVGGLISTATAGLKASGSAVQKLFTPSDAKKVDKLIKISVDRLRTEVNDMDASAINETIENFVNKVDRKVPDYADLKNDLQQMSAESAGSDPMATTAKWMALEKVVTTFSNSNTKINSADAKQKLNDVKRAIAEAKEAYQKGDGTADGVKNAVATLTATDKQQIEKKIASFKSTIINATPDGFDKDQVLDQLKTIINDPTVLSDAIKNKFKGLDRQSIIDYLNENTALDRDQLNQYADKIEQSVQQVAAQFDKENEDRITARMERRVAEYLNSTGRSELRYDDLKNDFVTAFNNPKDSLDVIKSRLNKLDGASVKALVTNNRFIDEAQIDKVSQSITDAKQYVADKIIEIEEKSIQQYKVVKRKAVIKAEHARKTASVAAWWLVITAVTSAAAAVAGGLI